MSGEEHRQSSNGTKRASELPTSIISLNDHKDVHSTNLGQLLTEKPKDLVIALLLSHLLRGKSRGVVEAKFVTPSASGPRSNTFADSQKRDAPLNTLEVGTHGGDNDVQEGTV